MQSSTMHISEIFKQCESTFSFEFFPPRNPDASERLFQTISELSPFKPAFVSITYGAASTSRDLTEDLVIRLKSEGHLNPVPHLTCWGQTEDDIEKVLVKYANAGVSNILVIAGDPPSAHDQKSDRFRYAADLVAFIKKFNDKKIHPDPKGFGIGVAGFPEGHPATPNRIKEMEYFKAKVDAGADYICTQLFFDNRDFYDFRERCEIAGVHIPILAGIMPITSLHTMERIAELALGARLPAPLLRAIARCKGDEDGVRRVGVHWATEQCRALLDHKTKGIHFYTLNQSRATRKIYETLGIRAHA